MLPPPFGLHTLWIHHNTTLSNTVRIMPHPHIILEILPFPFYLTIHNKMSPLPPGKHTCMLGKGSRYTNTCLIYGFTSYVNTHTNEHNTSNPTHPQPLMFSSTYGDKISLCNDIIKMKFYGINIHGIFPANKYADGQHLAYMLKLLQVDVWDIQELNLNTQCPHIRHDVLSTFKINDQQVKFQIPTSQELFPTKNKPGGALPGIISKLVGQIHTHDSNILRCWNWIILCGKTGKGNNHHYVPMKSTTY